MKTTTSNIKPKIVEPVLSLDTPMLNLNRSRNSSNVKLNSNGFHKNVGQIPVFENITFCASCISSSEILTNIFQIVSKMGGSYSTDLSSAVNVLLLDLSNLSYEQLFQSKKYSYIVDKRPDIVIMDIRVLQSIHFSWCNNSLGSILSALSSTSVNSENDKKTVLLKVLKLKYAIKPFQMLLKKNIFIGRIDGLDEEHEISAISLHDIIRKDIVFTSTISTTNPGSTTNNAPVVDYQRYVTASGRNESIFITNNMNGTRTEAARADGLPIIHPKWVIDCNYRECLVDYNDYLLTKIHNLPYEEIGGSSIISCWKQIEQYRINENDDADLLKKHEEEIFLNSTMMKRKDPLVWNKMLDKSLNPNAIPAPSDKNKHTESISGNFHYPEEEKKKTKRIFENYKFYSYQFSDRHYKILHKIIVQNGGTLQQYTALTSDDLHQNTKNNSVANFASPSKKRPIANTQTSNLIIIVPHNFQVDFLPNFFLKTVNPRFQLVTEFFIERCLHYNQLIPIDYWCKPFFTKNLFVYKKTSRQQRDKNTPISLAITGFQGIELLHLLKILNLINTDLPNSNLKFSKYLNKKTDLLLINLSFFHKTIPRTNPLWYKNKYSNLFELEYQSLSSLANIPGDQNDSFLGNAHYAKNENMEKLHKESVKKKLEFIKKNNPIPSCTPAVLFEIFEKALTKNLDIPSNVVDKLESDSLSDINLNDQLWCVTCPKKYDSRKDYDEYTWQVFTERQIVKEDTEDIGSTVRIKKKEILLNFDDQIDSKRQVSPAKKSQNWAKDLMTNENSPIKRKRTVYLNHDISDDSLDDASRKKTNVSRPGSMSNGNSKTGINSDKDALDVEKTTSIHRDIQMASTQLTYGESAAGNMENLEKTKIPTHTSTKRGMNRVTRQQLKSASNL